MAGLHETIGSHVAPTDMPARLPDLDAERTAFFFDFDGVIADIAPTPDAVEVPEDRARVIEALREASGGAFALVSGREIDDVLSHLTFYSGAASGGHGAETRWPDGTREGASADASSVEAVQREMRAFAAANEGLLYEGKRLGGVLHYRAAPQLEAMVREKVEALLADHSALELQVAKMAFEVKPAGFSKGSVIERFMAHEPFAGRRPLYVGDDVTDEAAFAVVNAMDGVSVKVGEGETVARYRVETSDELFVWLAGVAG